MLKGYELRLYKAMGPPLIRRSWSLNGTKRIATNAIKSGQYLRAVIIEYNCKEADRFEYPE